MEHLRPTFEDGKNGESKSYDFKYDPEVDSLFVLSKKKLSFPINYDRGHLAAAANHPEDTHLKETYYYSNAAPQWNETNRNLWRNIEIVIR